MSNPFIEENDELAAKEAVLKQALGLCALPEEELYPRLETLYWQGYLAGLQKVEVVSFAGLTEKSALVIRTNQPVDMVTLQPILEKLPILPVLVLAIRPDESIAVLSEQDMNAHGWFKQGALQ